MTMRSGKRNHQGMLHSISGEPCACRDRSLCLRLSMVRFSCPAQLEGIVRAGINPAP